MWRVFSVALVLTLASGAQNSQRATGSAQGLVLDGDGKPLADATVFVGNLAKGPRTKTDADGKFTLTELPAGDITLMAYKERDGYPYDMFSFFLLPGQQLTNINVIAEETVSNVAIRLGAKAAYLKLEVTDEDGVPVDPNLSFSRPDLGKYGDYRTSATANDVILVPPVPFRLTVEATGFEPWHYRGIGLEPERDLVHLKSGQTLTLAVHLRRIAGASNFIER